MSQIGHLAFGNDLCGSAAFPGGCINARQTPPGVDAAPALRSDHEPGMEENEARLSIVNERNVNFVRFSIR